MNKRPAREDGVRQLFDLIRRVNSSTDTTQVLSEVVACVVDNLGFGLAAIARLESDTLVVQAYAGPEDLRDQLLGRRTPVEAMDAQFRLADCWGVLRYVPHDRVDNDFLENAWIPVYEPIDAPDAWHPEDALYAPLYSATGELVGNMAVDFPPDGRIPDRELRELLELFVVQAGLALSNAQQRERLAEQVRVNSISRDVALATSEREIDTALSRAVQAIVDGFGVAQAWVRYVTDPASPNERGGAAYPPVEDFDELPDPPDQLLDMPRPDQTVLVETSHRELPQVPLGRSPGGNSNRRYAGAVSAIPLQVGNESVGYLALAHDRDLELTIGETAALAEMARELGRCVLNHRLARRESRLVTELQQLDRYKDDLIATISHELKTPLTSIMGHAELMSHEPDGPTASVLAIRRSAERLNSLIANLLDYARVQHERDLRRRSVDIVTTVKSSIELHDLQAQSLGIRLKLESPDAVIVHGDPDELGRVVDNLIGNAIKYSPAGGNVKVSVNAGSGVAEVAVRDHGLGISAEDQSRLFSPFYRSRNPAALAIPGTGLGLAIAQKIAVMHGGDILLESELGAGSTFRLRLPTGNV